MNDGQGRRGETLLVFIIKYKWEGGVSVAHPKFDVSLQSGESRAEWTKAVL